MSASISAIDRIMSDGKWRSANQILKALSRVDGSACVQDIQAWFDAKNTALDQGLRRKTDGKGHVYWRILPSEKRFQSSVLQVTEEQLLAEDLKRAEQEKAERARKEQARYRIPHDTDQESF